MLNVVDKILNVVAVIQDNSFGRVTYIGYGLDGWDLIACRGREFFSLQLYPDRLSGPLTPLSSGYQMFFLKGKGSCGMKLTIEFHLIQSLRTYSKRQIVIFSSIFPLEYVEN